MSKIKFQKKDNSSLIINSNQTDIFDDLVLRLKNYQGLNGSLIIFMRNLYKLITKDFKSKLFKYDYTNKTILVSL